MLATSELDGSETWILFTEVEITNVVVFEKSTVFPFPEIYRRSDFMEINDGETQDAVDHNP